MFDLIVIGGGPGGYVAAIRAAQYGMKVALVEKGRVGGTCLNRGCIPTKAMLHTANLYHELQSAETLGLKLEGLGFSWAAMHGRKAGVVEKLREGIEFLLKANKIELICGEAAVAGTGRVAVKVEGEEQVLEAEHILLATGAAPVVPPIPGMELPGVLTSDDLLEGTPRDYKSIAIIGGGVIGVEFASLYSSLGCAVTVLEAQPRLLPALDREIGQNLGMIMKKAGVAVATGAMVRSIETGAGLAVHFEQKGTAQMVEAEAVLVAIGRRPVLPAFTGLAPSLGAGGGVVVNEVFATSLPGVYAIGDMIDGGTQLAHVASAQGLAAVAHMAGRECPVGLATVPACVYTTPEIATVGLTADEAKAAGILVATGKFNMNALGKTVIEEAPRSFIKVVSHAETGVLLGAQLMCPRATDLVSEFATAIVEGLTAGQLAAVIRPHPTFTEGVTEAVEDIFGMAVHTAPKRKL